MKHGYATGLNVHNPTAIQLERARDLIFTWGICPTVKINVRGFCHEIHF